MNTRPHAAPAKRFRRMRGFGLLKLLLLIPLALVLMLILALAFFEGRKAYWDYRVREMCAKDGGVKIFERIQLNAEDYRRLNGLLGEIPTPERRSATTKAEYVSDTERTWIHRDSPEVYRTEATIRAVAGSRTLARYVNYARVGGDFPTFAHPSSFSCDQGYGSVSKQIFIIEGVEK
ncbi:MAG: hypothetical protein PHD37_18360 [Gallionellaceae bacterium]|nr:hypothetical protein [Gallionellaceae bacterium]